MERTEVNKVIKNYGIEDSVLSKILKVIPGDKLACIDKATLKAAVRLAQHETLACYVLALEGLSYDDALTLHAYNKCTERRFTVMAVGKEVDKFISCLITELMSDSWADPTKQTTLYQAVNLSKDKSLKEDMKDKLWYRIEQLKETLVKEYGCKVNDDLNSNLSSQETENKEGSEAIEHDEYIYDMFHVDFPGKLHELAIYGDSYEASFCYSKEGLRNLEGVMARIKELFLQNRQQRVAVRIILDFDRSVDTRIQKSPHGVIQLNYATYDSANMRYNKTIELSAEGVHLVLMDYFSHCAADERSHQQDVYKLVPAARLAGDYRLEVLAQYGLIRIIDSDDRVVETFGLCESGIIALADHLVQLAGQAEKTVSPS